jgi:hypothetical protein
MIPLEDYRHQRVVERSFPLYNQQGIKVRHGSTTTRGSRGTLI